jgi:hypothetical protein
MLQDGHQGIIKASRIGERLPAAAVAMRIDQAGQDEPLPTTPGRYNRSQLRRRQSGQTGELDPVRLND